MRKEFGPFWCLVYSLRGFAETDESFDDEIYACEDEQGHQNESANERENSAATPECAEDIERLYTLLRKEEEPKNNTRRADRH